MFSMLFSAIYSMESLKKCKNNDHTCLLQCINISCVSRKQFEQLPRATAHVNA